MLVDLSEYGSFPLAAFNKSGDQIKMGGLLTRFVRETTTSTDERYMYRMMSTALELINNLRTCPLREKAL